MNFDNSSSDVVFHVLEECQLEKFWSKIRDDLQIVRLSHFEHVKCKDLEYIGMSKPAAKRLLEYVRKLLNQNETSIMSHRVVAKKSLSIPSKSTNLVINKNSEDINLGSTSFIISETDLEISKEVLGTGHFGIVKKAQWTTPLKTKLNVAVKVLRENIMNDSNDFLNEISYMCGLNHKNLTKLYGIALTTERKTAIMVTELAPMGSLFNFIQSERENILYTMLQSYSYQIVCGMEFLESKCLVHRDLAARNILLFSRDKVKICDFGMMRRLKEKKDFLKIEPNSKVPYSWYPPEALKNKLFCIKSDVWTFGITLWEIFSFGERPWSNLSSKQILDKIENNERLKKPFYCTLKLFSIMSRCWLYDCDSRPTFQTLTKLIREAQPVEMKAKQNLDEINRLSIQIGDTITIIDGHASKYWWFGQNNRTFKYGNFARLLLDPQRKLNCEDISLPLKHSFIHTGHMSANKNEIWGYPDKIDEIFLKNPLNPPDMQSFLNSTNSSSASNSEDVLVENCLIDFNEKGSDTNSVLLNNELEEILYNNQDYVSFKPQITYENNNDHLLFNKHQQQRTFETPSLEIFEKSSPTITTSKSISASKEFKKSEFKNLNSSGENNKSKKIDIDEFLNKVMNDVINDLNSYTKLNNSNISHQNKSFFYPQETFIQPSNLRLPQPPPLPTYQNQIQLNSDLIYQNNESQKQHELYENSFNRAYF